MSQLSLDPSLANELTKQGASLLVREFPKGATIGIDYMSWQINDGFHGIKMIPPGIHYIYYAPPSPQPDSSPRTGFFIHLASQQVLVRIWNTFTETLEEMNDKEQESRLILGVQHMDFDRGMGCYPLDTYKTWNNLTSYITPHVVTQLNMDNKQEYSAMKYNIKDKVPSQIETSEMPTTTPIFTDATNTTSATTDTVTSSTASSSSSTTTDTTMSTSTDSSTSKSASTSTSTDSSTSTSASSTTSRRRPPATFHTQNFASARYTPIPAVSISQQATPQEKTYAYMDRSQVLNDIINKYHGSVVPVTSTSPSSSELAFLGEFQHAFIGMLMGQQEDSWEQWKAIVTLFCECRDVISQRPALYEKLMDILHSQLSSLPSDFFHDPISSDNFIQHKLHQLLTTLEDINVAKFGCGQMRLLLSNKFHWNWDMWDDEMGEDEDEMPVIVGYEGKTMAQIRNELMPKEKQRVRHSMT